ncbi:hypothetical protein, partial [Nocardia cyriacigeorgica]|uniref:hypothetical protein n=1 Tax=Nocardia cyriacigeorgica TaxID=135487 RepID=UPI002458C874
MADDPAPTEQRRLTTSDRDLDSFATDLFDESTAQSFGRRFERILTAVASDPRMRIADIDILDAAER